MPAALGRCVWWRRGAWWPRKGLQRANRFVSTNRHTEIHPLPAGGILLDLRIKLRPQWVSGWCWPRRLRVCRGGGAQVGAACACEWPGSGSACGSPARPCASGGLAGLGLANGRAKLFHRLGFLVLLTLATGVVTRLSGSTPHFSRQHQPEYRPFAQRYPAWGDVAAFNLFGWL